MSSERKYNFATILYQESAKPDFENVVSNWHIKAFLSPLHDKDKLDDGSPKKPHWHLELMFDSGQYPDHVKAMFVSIGGVGCEILKSKKSYARYLCHLDEIDKPKYDVSMVKEFGGADYKSMIEGGGSKAEIYGKIMDYIDDTNCKSYSQLLRYSRRLEPDWFAVLCKNGMVIKDYLRSKNWDDEQAAIETKDVKPWKEKG